MAISQETYCNETLRHSEFGKQVKRKKCAMKKVDSGHKASMN